MKKSRDHSQGIIIEFDSGIVPPPFSHFYRLALDWRERTLEADFEIHYTNREDLTEEEILDEGFTPDDNFSFRGELDYVWKKVIFQEFEKTKWSGRPPEEGGLSITAVTDGKPGTAKAPENQEAWQMLAQDVIQAIFETAKKEAPLTVNYRLVDNENIRDCAVTMKFSSRQAIVQVQEESREINWEYAVQLLKMVFTPDYNYELAKETPSNKRGAYIECGDGYWHELGKGVVNIDTSFDAVDKIKSGFENLISE